MRFLHATLNMQKPSTPSGPAIAMMFGDIAMALPSLIPSFLRYRTLAGIMFGLGFMTGAIGFVLGAFKD